MNVPGPSPAVLVDDLVVRFGDLTAVGGVSFAVAPGEVFAQLGPNGAGKTTTIRVLTTLLTPSAGRALVAGFDVRSQALAVRAAIGYIPRAISVDGALTARENLDFYARVTGVPGNQREQRIEGAIASMELQAMLDRIARVNPLTYEVQGLRQMLVGVGGAGEVWLDFAVVIGFFAIMLAGATRAYPKAIL